MAASTAAPATEYVVSLADVQAARERIAPMLHKTPVLTSSSLDKMASAGATTPRHALFKCELFQKSGSFKARGATNAVMSLTPEEAAKGVCTHSSGNHACALAMAAGMRGIKSYIVMPTDAPPVKRAAVEGYGGEVVPCEPNQKARETTAARVAAETGATFVHPSEDRRVIAGQGTIALELLEQAAEERKALAAAKAMTAAAATAAGCDASAAAASGAAAPSDEVDGPVVDAVIIPIGGGGMTSGMTIAIKGLDPRIKVIAAEPAAAGDAFKSKASGKIEEHDVPPKTIADGLKTTLGPTTFPVIRDLVDTIVCVEEVEIVAAMRLVYERLKVAIEPSAAVGVAALLGAEVKAMPGIKRVGVVLCGGNANLDALPF